MRKVKIGGVSYSVPEQWEECSTEQLIQLLPLQLVSLEEQAAEIRGRLKDAALVVLLPLPSSIRKDLTTEQLWQLGQLTRWVWKTKVTHKPFASFQHSGMEYLLPDDNFSNTTAIETAMANIHFLAYTRPEDPNPRAVFNIITTLCRPARKDLKKFRTSSDWNGDAREEYNTILADERAEKMDQLSLGIVMAILQYFEAMNNRFVGMYRQVYEADPEVEKQPPLYYAGEGLITTLMDIAQTGTFGDFDKVCKQNAHTLWLFLKDNNLKAARANRLAEQAVE
jgi:hypothetical protein